MIGIGPNLSCQPAKFVHKSGASLEYDFTLGTLAPVSGSEAITFTRSTAATAINELGLVETKSINQPRFDHDPNTIAMQNLLSYSEQFDNAAWAKSNVAIAADAAIAPSGSVAADTVTASAGSGSKYINKGYAATAVGHTFSLYAKAGTASWLGLAMTDNTALDDGAFFNLSTGTVGTVQSGTTATMANVGNGWYRCSISRTMTVSTRQVLIEIHTADAQATTWSAAGSETIYVWGAQANIGSLLPYTPTTSAAATVKYACKGLLIEEARTNLLPYSEAFSGNWTLNGPPTVNANYGVAPDGNSTSTLVSNGTMYRGITASIGTTYTYSVHVKQGSAATMYLFVDGGGQPSKFATFTFATQSFSGLTNVTSTTVKVLKDSWYLLSITFVADATSLSFHLHPIGAASTEFWGAQCEAGSVASSYIPTTTVAVTRAADLPVVSNLTPWFNTAEGTIYIEADTVNPASDAAVFHLDDGTGSNVIAMYLASSNSKTTFLVDVAAATQVSMNNGSALVANTTFKSACSYAANDFAISTNGAAVTTDTAGTLPTVTRLRLGSFVATGQLNGHLKKFAYHPRRIADAELVMLTA